VSTKPLQVTGRFGAMAAVIPQTISCKIERYYPVASSVEAATSPSRWTLAASGGQRSETKT